MALYSQSLTSGIVTAAAPCWSLLASSTNSAKLMECTVTLGSQGGTYGLGRPANDGSFTQSGGVAVLSDNPADPTGNTQTAVAWGTAPTVPVTFHRRVFLSSVQGVGVIWTFVHGLVVPTSHGLVLWNIASGSGNLCVQISVDE